jgi:hypothetical protein
VQWHPEYLPQQRPHQLLFHALVDAACVTRPRSAPHASTAPPDWARAP